MEEARGRLRDALGGVSNLDQLLHSKRVGPKALVSVLPDVAAACSDVRSAADELLGVFERYLPAPDAAAQLRAFVHSRVHELLAELAAADSRPMNARNRLQLENIVDRASRDLAAARWLIDLLDEALWSPPVRLKLHDLVREAAKTPVSAAESVESVAVTLARRESGGEVMISPRVGIGLVGIAVALVASKYPNALPHIAVDCDDDQLTGITIGKDRGEGEGLMLVRRSLIAPSLACLAAVASLTGARIEHDPAGSSVSLAWSNDLLR